MQTKSLRTEAKAYSDANLQTANIYTDALVGNGRTYTDLRYIDARAYTDSRYLDAQAYTNSRLLNPGITANLGALNSKFNFGYVMDIQIGPERAGWASLLDFMRVVADRLNLLPPD